MRIKFQNELILINILVVLLIVIVTLFPINIMRIILGLPFIFFFPGYVLMSALFPRNSDTGSVERVALSFGLSIAVVPLIGLVINYTPWGIRLYPILISLTIFIVGSSAVAWYRRHRLAEEERTAISFTLSYYPWRGQNMSRRILSLILLVVIVGAIGIMSYVIATPKRGQTFTEFYLLGLGGKATDYQREVNVKVGGEVIVVIVNNEYDTLSYRVEVRIDGVKNNDIEGIVLEQGQKWEQEVSFVPDKVGVNQKVEFRLYKDGEIEPYLPPLSLRINVN